MDLDLGLKTLKELAEGTDWYQEFAVHEASLRENLRDDDRYGPSEQSRRDRARIVDRLNELALEFIGMSFNDLCNGKTLPPFQQSLQEKDNKRQSNSSRKLKILFLAANPADTPRLRLDEEFRAIDQALRQNDYQCSFDLIQRWAVRVTDLQGLLLRYEPDIVHFSGHGSESSEIVLEDEKGASYIVPAHALTRLFSALQGQIRCVVLNACYSEKQAQAIADHVDCVVGMSKAIEEGAAISFVESFYLTVGFRKDVKAAFELGLTGVELKNLGAQDAPKLLAKRTPPERIVLCHGP